MLVYANEPTLLAAFGSSVRLATLIAECSCLRMCRVRADVFAEQQTQQRWEDFWDTVKRILRVDLLQFVAEYAICAPAGPIVRPLTSLRVFPLRRLSRCMHSVGALKVNLLVTREGLGMSRSSTEHLNRLLADRDPELVEALALFREDRDEAYLLATLRSLAAGWIRRLVSAVFVLPGLLITCVAVHRTRSAAACCSSFATSAAALRLSRCAKNIISFQRSNAEA